MPHKRAKHSERMADRAKKGMDLPPNNDLHFHSLPKGAMRILNAASIQADFHAKKKQREADLAKRLKGKGKAEEGSLQIRDGERIGDFNRRVESTMAKEINSSIRATLDSNKKRKRKTTSTKNVDDGDEDTPALSSSTKKRTVPKEPKSKDLKREREAIQNGSKVAEMDFQMAASRKRVNDVVQAPPNLTRAPRGESKSALENKAKLKALLTGQATIARPDPKPSRLPDPIQKGGLRREAMLREERDRVIQAYRNNKQAQLNERQ